MVTVSAYRNTEAKSPIPTKEYLIVKGIRDGKWKTAVMTARLKKDTISKDAYDEYRLSSVPCWTPALNIKAKGKANYKPEDFVGRFALDVDDLTENQSKNRKILMRQPWVIMVFTSIGGQGLCAIGKCHPAKFKESVNSAILHLKELGVTAMGGQDNPNRVRFVSDDPDIYYHHNVDEAPDVPIIEVIAHNVKSSSRKENLPVTPVNNDGVNNIDIFKKIIEIKSPGGEVWSEGTRHAHLISIFTFCNKIGMDRDFVLDAAEEYCRPMMENATDYDISKKIYDIYQQYAHEHNTKQWEHKKKEMDESVKGFWDVADNLKITISRNRLIQFLADRGFGLYFLDETKKAFDFVKQTNRQIEIVNTTQIAQYVNEYLKALPDEFDGITREKLVEAFLRGIDTYASKGFLAMIPAVYPDFLKDTRECSYFSFRNGAIEVGMNGLLRSVSYEDLNKDVWKSSVIDFDIKIDPEYNIMDGGEYAQFIQKATGDDATRYLHAMTITGYMLHRYKDPARAYGIILAEETEKENEGGGTGKSLLIKGVSKLRNVVTIDGKTDKADKSFRFQRVSPDTELMSVEDCSKKTNFEDYYPAITEGITAERKNQHEVFIPYDRSPKLAFTTNYTLSNIGNHAKRRQRVLEFSNFFSPERTPETHFGHLLFVDWDKDEWNRFYNFMFWAVGMYLNEGIREMDNSQSIRRKQIRQNFSEEFLDWWDGYAANGRIDFKLSADLYNDFTAIHEVEPKEFSKKRFKTAMEHASNIFGYRFEKELKKDGENKGKPMYRVIDVIDLKLKNHKSIPAESLTDTGLDNNSN